MKYEADAFRELETLLDSLLSGQTCENLPDSSQYPQTVRPLAEKLLLLLSQLQELGSFSRAIASGNLECTPPGRKNYLSAPIKELHSQLISFCYSIRQLLSGNMVSKLYYPGELFQCYNDLIEKVSLTFGNLQSDQPEWGSSVTSWRYHQILSAINQLHIMILEVDLSGTVVFANPPAKEVFPTLEALPYHAPEAQDVDLLKYLCTFSTLSAQIADNAAYTPAHSGFPVLSEIFDQSNDAWYKITSDLVQLTSGSYGILHMIDDISEWKRHEHQLKITATIDALTNAYTRRAGLQKLDELLASPDPSRHCVAFADLDNLKGINDTHGHAEGDFAIKTISEHLISCVRHTDWVIRYGGDEFLILFLDCERSVAEKLLDRMQSRLTATNERLQKPYLISFSSGLVPIPPETSEVSELIAIVDQEMYQNKMAKKNNMQKQV